MSDETPKKKAPAPATKSGRCAFREGGPDGHAPPADLRGGGAAFGGAKVRRVAHVTAPAAAEPAAAEALKPPGPTLDLDPFLLTVTDGNKKGHPMKVTIAIEFADGPKAQRIAEDGLKVADAADPRRHARRTCGQLTYESAIGHPARRPTSAGKTSSST